MSQNLSKMSDIYIPELIELDSYWQKAVEDAIYDTLKGEKRLYYALRNRKKINEKLEKLGLKPVYSQTSFLGRYQFSAQSLESRKNLNYERCKSSSNTEWDSYEENSSGSLESAQNEGVCSQEVLEPNRASFSPVGSKSKSKDRKETPPEKIYRNPERPILGNGSLEKMKKSQNSFYCEPMGPEDGMLALTEEIISDCDKKKEPTQTVSDSIMKDEKNKKVEWLHFREGKAFEDSDTEMSSNELSKEKMQNDEHQTNIVDKDANFYCEQK